MATLVIDVGTSSLRAVVIHDPGHWGPVYRAPLPLRTPSGGIVEFDADLLAASVLELAQRACEHERVDDVAIATQRASTIVWDRQTGRAVGPAIGWQDLRTVGRCLLLQREGIRLAPNQSATKLAYLLDTVDPKRSGLLLFGTIDSWIAWTLSKGRSHITDATNAAVSGLRTTDARSWDKRVLEALSVPESVLPTVVDTFGDLGEATALPSAPRITVLIGDQQASLVGQGCVREGQAKATFGTGAMLDCCTGAVRPHFEVRGEAGTFPIVSWQRDEELSWGLEGIMLTAGACVAWLCSGLHLIDDVEESDVLARSVRDTGGAVFVPALAGLGTPTWDFGARGTFLGLNESTSRAELVRAVLEGIAQRGADLLESAEADSGMSIDELRVDGGMSTNETFVELLAQAIGRPVAVAARDESTTLGAALLSAVATGQISSLDESATHVTYRRLIEPERRLDRSRWQEVRGHAESFVPALSTFSF